jgi:hypothetical protein
MPLFLQRAFIGGTGESYEQYAGLSFAFLGYLSHGLLLLPIILSATRPVRGLLPFAAAFLAFQLLCLLQLALSSRYFNISVSQLALPLARGEMWLLAVASYAFYFYHSEAWVSAFVKWATFAAAGTIACLVLYLITGVAFGVNVAGDIPRAHGFVSEPSTLACILSGLVALAIYRGNLYLGMLAIVAALLSFSVITYVAVATLAVIALLARVGRVNIAACIVMLVCGSAIAIPAILTTRPEVAESIAERATAAADRIAGNDEDHSLMAEVFTNRVLGAATQLAYLSSSVSPDSLGGALARLAGVFAVAGDLQLSESRFCGFGLSIFGYVSTLRLGDVLDFGFYPYLLSSFGVIGGPLLLVLVALSIVTFLRAEPHIGLIYAGFFIATVFNSAGGIHAYSPLILCALLTMIGGFRSRPLSSPGEDVQTPGGRRDVRRLGTYHAVPCRNEFQ